MSTFEFATDDKSHRFGEAIVEEMVRRFQISRDEAVGRTNRHWRGVRIVGEKDVVYHEDEEFWANTIYFGKNSMWWKNPPGLKPLPYP